MASSIICFDDKYISAVQLVIADDCVLEGFIHNLSKSPNGEIRGYLQDAKFLYTSHMLEDYKLDPTLINALVERWGPKTHTFHLPCGECTITLEDIALQVGLPVGGPVVMGAVVIPGKEDIYKAFLGKVLNKFQDVNQWLPAPAAAMDVVVATIFTSPSKRPLYIPIGDNVEPWAELCGTTRVARRYSIVVRSTLGSRCRQKIFPALQDIETLRKLDLQGKSIKIGVYFATPLSPTYYTPMPTSIPTYLPTIMIPRYYTQPGFTTLYDYSSIVSQTPTASLIYQGGSSSQPPSCRMEGTRRKARMALYLTMKEGDGDKDEDGVEMKMKARVEMKMNTGVEVNMKKMKTMIMTKRKS
ncbi:hypothetical protein Gotur_021893 [Gossypium turneri]